MGLRKDSKTMVLTVAGEVCGLDNRGKAVGLRDERRQRTSDFFKEKRWETKFFPLCLSLFYRLSILSLVKWYNAQGTRRRLRRAPRGCMLLLQKDSQEHRVTE